MAALREELDHHARQPLASLPGSLDGMSAGGAWGSLGGAAALAPVTGSNGGDGPSMAALSPAAAVMLQQLLAEEARSQGARRPSQPAVP